MKCKICGNEVQTNDEVNEVYQSNTTVTDRNRAAMEVNNNTLRISHVNKNGIIRWRCVKKNYCKANLIITNKDRKDIQFIKTTHNHQSVSEQKKNGINNRKTITIKRKAKDDLSNKPSKLVCNE